jgi:hypothetical protein
VESTEVKLDNRAGFGFLKDISQDICFKETNIYLDDFETAKNSKLISRISELEVYSFFNQLNQVRIPCKDEISEIEAIESGLPYETASVLPKEMADPKSTKPPLKYLTGFSRISLRGAPPKIYLKSSRANQIWALPIKPFPSEEKFVNQQMEIFNDTPLEERDRLFRYFKSQKAYHRPIESFGKILNPLPEEKPDPKIIKFGQATVNSIFSDYNTSGVTSEENNRGEITGRPLADVISDLKSKKLKPSDIRIHVFKYLDKKNTIHWVTANNRSLTVLRLAGFEPQNIKVFTVEELRQSKGPDNISSVLNRLVSMPSELPSTISFIRVDGFNSLGVKRMAWNWDAPMGIRVGGK